MLRAYPATRCEAVGAYPLPQEPSAARVVSCGQLDVMAVAINTIEVLWYIIFWLRCVSEWLSSEIVKNRQKLSELLILCCILSVLYT